MGWRVLALAAAVAWALSGCDTKPIGTPGGPGGGGKSAPSKELDTVSHMPDKNPAPLVDPTGSVQVYKGAKHQIGCENNLQQLGMCLQTWILGGHDYPAPGAFYRTLLEGGAIGDINICAVPRANVSRDDVMAQMGDKVYKITMDRLNDSTQAEKPIAWDPVPFEDGRHYLRFDGSVKFATEDEFKVMMEKWEGKK